MGSRKSPFPNLFSDWTESRKGRNVTESNKQLFVTYDVTYCYIKAYNFTKPFFVVE
jgi:hypothetical protein